MPLKGVPLKYDSNGQIPSGFVKLKGKDIMIKKSDYEGFQTSKSKSLPNKTPYSKRERAKFRIKS